MTTTLAGPFVPLFFLFLRSISNLLEIAFRRLLRPHPDSLVRGAIADLTYSRAELHPEPVEGSSLRMHCTFPFHPAVGHIAY
jgi:hypothetical protein